MSAVKGFLSAIAGRKDLVVIIIVLLGITMMVLPIPEILLDFMLAINMSVSAAILVTTFYLKSPTQIATFPGLLLVTALLRLSASIASTRLILLHGLF
jgi:type III secretion protein V